VLVGWIGGSVTFGFATALSAIAVILLSGLREPLRAGIVARHPLADLRAGGSFLFSHPLLRPIFFTAVFFNVGFFVLMGIFVAYAHRHLGLSAGEIGITLALDGAGMLVGALIAGRILRWLPFGIVLLIGPFMGLVASLFMVGTIWIDTPILAGLGMFTIGVGPTIWTISSVTLRQTVTPDAMLGRVSAVIMTATYGARPIGATLGAIVGSTISLPACVIAATLGFAIQAAIIATSAAARLTDLPDSVDSVG
jgi:predicted MFS family arabinose efflux permease